MHFFFLMKNVLPYYCRSLLTSKRNPQKMENLFNSGAALPWIKLALNRSVLLIKWHIEQCELCETIL